MKKYKRGNVSRIVRDGEIMRYQYKPGNVMDYLTYDETLYKILGTYGVSPYLGLTEKQPRMWKT